MRIGLFFGTFNPVHVGHMIIANYMVEYTNLEEVWMIVTPQNPFKQKQSMLKDYDRLHLIKLAIGDDPRLKASDIEFKLPQPNYTITSLAYLIEKFPQHQFGLIMGTDNLNYFHKWKDYKEILNVCDLYVYPRISQEVQSYQLDEKHIQQVDAPIITISSSFIRKAIKENKDVRYYLPKKTAEYIAEMNLYK